MEQLQRTHKISKNLMTIFTVSLLAIPFTLYKYMTTESTQVVYFIGLQILFIALCFCGIIGGFLTAKVIGQVEKDVFAKLKIQNDNFKITKLGYNSYKLEEKSKEIYLDKGDFKIDLNAIPSSQVEINFDKKIITYI